MTLAAILCTDAAGLLGVGGRLPWNLPAERRLFREVTRGKVVVMGRRTWESLGERPLPGRVNVVLSRSTLHMGWGGGEPINEGPYWLSMRMVPMLSELYEGRETVVIGGADIYEQCWPLVTRVHWTRVAHTFDAPGGVYLPAACDVTGWRETDRRTMPAGEGNAHRWTHRVLCR